MKKLNLLCLFFTVCSLSVMAQMEFLSPTIYEAGGKQGLRMKDEIILYPRFDSININQMYSMHCDIYKRFYNSSYHYPDSNDFAYKNVGVFEENGKKGIFCDWGITCPAQYDDIKLFTSNATSFKPMGFFHFACFKENGKYGIMDMKGNAILPAEYDTIWNFSYPAANMKQYSKKASRWMTKSTDGLYQANECTNIFFFVKKNGVQQIVDLNNTVLETSFPEIKDITESKILPKIFASAMKAHNKNFQDKEYASSVFDKIRQLYQHGCYLKSLGEEQLDGINFFKPVCQSFAPSDLKIQQQDGHYGILDTQGNVIVPFSYDKIGEFNADGVADLKLNGVNGHLNTFGYVSLINEIKFDLQNEWGSYLNILKVDSSNVYAYYLLTDMAYRYENAELAYMLSGTALDLFEEKGYTLRYSQNRLAEMRRKSAGWLDGSILKPSEAAANTSYETDWISGLLQSTAGVISSANNLRNGTTSSGYNSDYTTASTSGSGNSSQTNDQSHSSSEVRSKNTDQNTYSKYESQLIRMRSYPETYNETQKKDIQSKMKSIRMKWEQRGFKMFHSELEDWSK